MASTRPLLAVLLLSVLGLCPSASAEPSPPEPDAGSSNESTSQVSCSAVQFTGGLGSDGPPLFLVDVNPSCLRPPTPSQ